MAVEFDTWLDKQDKDTSANHVGVNLKGSPFSVKTANVSKDLNNGGCTSHGGLWPGESESLRVFVNASNTKPDNPSLSMNLSLCDLLQPTPKKNSYYFGFVAASLPRHEQEHLVATTTIDIAAAAAETGNYIVSGFERTAFKGYFGLMLAVRRQPVVVHIEASAASFVNYNGSFRYDEPDCYTGNLNHVVLVTGYLLMGTDKNRPRTLSPFWRIRNSWGTEWGRRGTFTWA
ncbi:hypothetical protein CLOM_g23100 [Closterium sp. NIES-68]|nr:hypothetical protein CLOM_g23100 [Closterium sp. NIES-68]